jgi:hypothetical protein
LGWLRPVFLAVAFSFLKLWLDLPGAAASIAAGISALGALAGSVLGLVKTTLEIEKLTQEPKTEAGRG